MNIRKYIPLVIIIALTIIPSMILSKSGLDRIESKLITLEPKNETSTQCAVEEKNSTPVSSLLGLTTRMTYSITYTNNGETETALVEESIYRKVTDVIYITPTTSPNPLPVALYLIGCSATIAVIIFAVKDLNLGVLLRSLIKR